MNKILVRKEPDGWRAVIKNGKQLIVLEDYFEDEQEAMVGAAASIDKA